MLLQWTKVPLCKGYQGDLWRYEIRAFILSAVLPQLADWGFKKNDYEACTMNKMVNGSQLTIV